MLEFFTISFFSVFLVVDALGNLPLFITLLNRFNQKERIKLIRKSFFVALVLFYIFSFFGKYIFEILSIEFYSFYIAGGLLLSIIALEMLQGKRVETRSSEKEEELMAEKEHLAITPLAIPLLTGPGAITTGLLLFESIGLHANISNIARLAEFMIGTFLAYLLSYFILSRSIFFSKLLGDLGLKVMARVMGLLLLSLGIQFVCRGIIQFMAAM
ncbi:MAG: MarC family protein [Candidatus Diapherotrites archaeon]